MQSGTQKKFRLSRKGIKLFLQKEENIQALKSAYDNGVPWHIIEERFGISRSKCQNILKENGCVMIRNKKGGNRIFYSEEKVQALKIAFDQGMSWEEMSEKFHASPSTCMRALKKLGIDIKRSKKFFDDKDKFETLKKAYKSGLSWLDIESIFHFQVSSKTCMNALKEAGYELGKKREPRGFFDNKEHFNALVSLYESGVSIREIAKRFEVHSITCYKAFRKYGYILSRRKKSSNVQA